MMIEPKDECIETCLKFIFLPNVSLWHRFLRDLIKKNFCCALYVSAATNNIDKERNSIQNSNVCKEFPKQISLNSITYSSYH